MGTVFQKNGKWYINYRFRGKRYKRMVGRSKKKAMEALRVVEADVIRDRFGLPAAKKMTFRELAVFWLENYSKVSNAPSQYEKNKERIDNHLLPSFGDQDIANITPRRIDEYKKSKTGEISSATINRTLAILRKMFNDAIRWGFLAASPMRHVSQLREPEKGFDFYQEDEVVLFLRNCSRDFFPIACCAVYTGMRVSEIVGLKWTDVDLDRKVIRIERSGEGTTKSRKVRYVPVNSRLLNVLKTCRQGKNGELVFHDGDGQMRSIDFRTEMRKAAEKAGIRKIRMHDLRHTFASNYIIKGGNLVCLQKILGHSTINMTLRYAHLAPDFMAKDIERLDFEVQWSPDGPREEAIH
jgi:integrase